MFHLRRQIAAFTTSLQHALAQVKYIRCKYITCPGASCCAVLTTRAVPMGILIGATLVSAAALMVAAPEPATATTIFALVDTGELYASTDGGAGWQVRATLPVTDAVGLAAGTSSLDLFVATASGTIYRSTDGGTSWSAVGAITASDVAGFAVGPFGALLALTRSGTAYSSSNGGSSFTAIGALTGSDWVSIARGPQGRLYALARTGEVAQSMDQGATWSVVGAAAVSNAISLRRRNDDLHLLTATGEIYRSVDFGTTWVPVSALTASGMRALLDVNGSTLLAAAATGEVASSANGTAWSWVGAINQLHVVALGSDTPQVTGVPVDPVTPRFGVASAYPNPRVGEGGALFSFDLGRPDVIKIELFDVAGRLLAVRASEWVASGGRHSLQWEPKGVPPGTYLARITASSGSTFATKWTLVR
jgi:hypothetical protein